MAHARQPDSSSELVNAPDQLLKESSLGKLICRCGGHTQLLTVYSVSDSGGVRGLSSIVIPEHLMERISESKERGSIYGKILI